MLNEHQQDILNRVRTNSKIAILERGAGKSKNNIPAELWFCVPCHAVAVDKDKGRWYCAKCSTSQDEGLVLYKKA